MEKHNVVVVTDSSAYIPEEALGELEIPVIPLWLMWGEERFRDGVDIDPITFYRRLEASETLPTTSQPSVGEFEDFCRRVGANCDSIVGVFVTSKLSGTVANALAVQAEIPEIDLHVVDSQSTSMGLGFQVLAAARAAAKGKSVDEVVAAAEEMREKVRLYIAMDTLEYLHKGGRISGARWLLGTALKIKPVLHFMDGILAPLVQVRTRRKSIQRLLETVEQQSEGKRVVEAAVIDANCVEEGDEVAEQVKQRFGLTTIYRTPVSPAIGVHAGPGTVGVAFYVEP